MWVIYITRNLKKGNISMKSKVNIVSIIFAIVFTIIAIVRFENLELIEVISYALAIIGFLIMGIIPLFNRNK